MSDQKQNRGPNRLIAALLLIPLKMGTAGFSEKSVSTKLEGVKARKTTVFIIISLRISNHTNEIYSIHTGFAYWHDARLRVCNKQNSTEEKTPAEGNFLPAFLALYLLGLL
jgi:hypothetical protein